MKALSIRQPWAWLIVHGFKDIENRTWSTRFRGRVLVHASKGMTQAEYDDAFVTAHYAGMDVEKFPQPVYLDRGGIVGAVTITDCISPEHRKSDWHMGSAFGFQLDAPIPMPLIECKGRLGFFDVPDDVATQIREIAAARADAIKRRFDEYRAAAPLGEPR